MARVKRTEEEALDVLYPPKEALEAGAKAIEETFGTNPAVEENTALLDAQPKLDEDYLCFRELKSRKLSDDMLEGLPALRQKVEELNEKGVADGLLGTNIHGTRLMTRFKSLENEMLGFAKFLQDEGLENA